MVILPKDKIVYTYTCIGEERALRTDSDINDTIKISSILICGICIGASLWTAVDHEVSFSQWDWHALSSCYQYLSMYCTDTNMVVCMLIWLLVFQEMWHKAVCTMLSYCDILDYTTLPASGTLHHYMFTHTHNGLADRDSPQLGFFQFGSAPLWIAERASSSLPRL